MIVEGILEAEKILSFIKPWRKSGDQKKPEQLHKGNNKFLEMEGLEIQMSECWVKMI